MSILVFHSLVVLFTFTAFPLFIVRLMRYFMELECVCDKRCVVMFVMLHLLSNILCHEHIGHCFTVLSTAVILYLLFYLCDILTFMPYLLLNIVPTDCFISVYYYMFMQVLFYRA